MFRRLSQAHSAIARFGLNLAVVFVVFNTACWLLGRLLDSDPITARYGREIVEAGYPGLGSGEVDQLLRETWKRDHVYAPYTQYTEAACRGRYVNVDPAGFRWSNGPAPWPPDPGVVNVFVFGGSTLFGYGVADGETIPARLEPLLSEQLGRPVRCYNFGRGGYFSSQEQALFGELLLAGRRPDLAVFVDGLNDLYFDEPMYTDRMRRLFANRPVLLFLRFVRHLPALDLPIRWIARRGQSADPARPPLDPAYDLPEVLDARIARYLGTLRQIRAVARDADVAPFFVVQPVPTYHYDLKHHPFAAWGFEGNSASGFGYPRLAAVLAGAAPDPDLLWLGDLQDGVEEERLYVDEVHYSAAMSARIAGAIAEGLHQRNVLLPEPP